MVHGLPRDHRNLIDDERLALAPALPRARARDLVRLLFGEREGVSDRESEGERERGRGGQREGESDRESEGERERGWGRRREGEREGWR